MNAQTRNRPVVPGMFLTMLLILALGARAQEVSWSVPEDGGTPRDSKRIERKGTNEFHIRSFFEDGGQSALRHAISRVDLICRNDGTKPVAVTVHLDLSGDGKRTDYDTKPESGMALRDFAFIQPPGKDWQQVNGKTERWIATVSFTAMPGETKFGLGPWYTYGDYLRFVNGLPRHPHLKKEANGKSDGGREHWELTITDPSVPGAQKKTVLWHAREHAYETFSSHATEGLVGFLLSDAASDFRKRFIIVVHPMVNVDGVANGFEYRGSYDLPDPHGTATGRYTFAGVDRWKPDYVVAWHNWVAPRDRNVMFYTDGKNGRPAERAWWRFTQLFPSLHAFDHRWKDEITPLRYNWEGRRPLSELNVHQYAMKKYGTRVWGWEMPWWNCTTADARQLGAAFGRAFLTTISEIQSGTVPAVREAAAVETPRHGMHEFSLQAKAVVENPFRDAALVGEFVSPSGKTNVVDGFYDGDNTWRLRFSPNEEGAWSYLLRGEGVEILQRGTLKCTPAKSSGFIGKHPENPYAFARADGTPFLPLGDTCYGLFDDSPITPALRAEYLKTRRAQNFNFVRFTIGHSEARAATNGQYWAWGGTAKKPDLDRFNPEFFRGFDAFMRELQANRMNAEVIVLNFYRKPFTDTNIWTQAREKLWLRYVLARYAAFDNVFLWTLANEYETHPDGKYRLDYPGDVEWAKETSRFIKTNDPYKHLITVHPVISASRKGESPRAGFEDPWRIGEFFGSEPAIDVLSHQTGQHGEGTVWSETLNAWTGDSVTLVESVKADRKYQKPVLNTENGYEYLRGDPTSKKQVHHTDKVRRSSWRIICAGGHVGAGFHGTIGHSDVWNRIDPGHHYTFLIKDEGAAGQLGIMHAFFSKLPYWKMQPLTGLTGDAVGLTEAGKVQVVFLPKGGKVTVPLTASGGWIAKWFNPRTGEPGASATVASAATHEFTAPDALDWALLLERANP